MTRVGAVIVGSTGRTSIRKPVSNEARAIPGLAAQLFGSGITRSDIDVAMIYDAFSPILLMQLEALGFCGFGEAKDFIADGNLGPVGRLPCNTNGGLIGEGYIHGLNLTVEAVRQLRGASVNQVPDARTVLVSASRTGAILQRDD